MSLLGVRLTMLAGPTVPVPIPLPFAEALVSAEVTHEDEGRSGFQVQFAVGRGRQDVLDYALLQLPLLRPGMRVILVVTFGPVPAVLMDGIITNQQLAAGDAPGTATLTVTGEDVSVMLDVHERSAEHPAQSEMVIAAKLIAQYAQYGLVPMVIPPPTLDMPIPIERIPVQQGTDLAYLQEMAARFGYVFYVLPGPAPMMNTAYWGPPIRVGVPQRALSVNMGPNTNVVGSIDFQYDALAPTRIEGQLQDRRSNQTVPVTTFASTRPPLSSQPAWATQPFVRTRQLRESGLDTTQAFARAQGEMDASVDRTLTGTGELDAARYGAMLQPRALVGVRGAGYAHDGLWYVKRVTHSIRRGEYHQRFTLLREGLGSITPAVVP